jgi:hypothetical protein
MTNLTTLDFDLIKENLKGYLKEQSIFQDYDFEGSNINVLLDVLAYNSYLNGFYLNMIGNEMFLDSALLRDSIISHTKELNYVPRSFRSATANVNLIISDSVSSSVVIPRGTSFTGTAGNKNFTFVTGDNVITRPNGINTFVANNVSLYEGDYVSDTFVVDNSDQSQRFIISNKTVDVTSLLVAVLEDNGSVIRTYTKEDTLFGLNALSEVFFLQPADNNRYEIVFGDGVIGRKPQDRAIVTVQYRACNGELPNGISLFAADGRVGTSLITNVVVNQAAAGGAISESIESIKFNAPRAFTTQERVVTARDYKTLLTNQFTEINDVSAYGGEESNPPRFGKVIIAVDLKNTDELPPSRTREYTSFIKQRSPLAIDPVFVKPDYTYIKVNCKVRYNINQTQLTSNDIQFIVNSAIQNYNAANLNGFNKTLRYSRLVSAIDNSQIAIVSNDTEVFALKSFTPVVRASGNYDIDFGVALKDNISTKSQIHPDSEISIISSSPFIFNGLECFIEDDGNGLMYIAAQQGTNHVKIQEIGTANYDKGFVQIKNFVPETLLGNGIDLFARAFDLDITSERKTILSIRPQDTTVTVEQVRI